MLTADVVGQRSVIPNIIILSTHPQTLHPATTHTSWPAVRDEGNALQEMCFNAFARLVNAKEPVEAYEQKIIARVRETVQRLRYANTVMPDVKDDIQGA